MLPLGLLALGTVIGEARAQSCTTINALPYAITQPGTYCLAADQLTTLASGAAVTIQSDNVALDLGGRVIENVAGSSNTAIGISMPQDHVHVSVANGVVRGFDTGIRLGRQAAGLVDVNGVHVDRCLRIGISVVGHDSTIRSNFVSSTGGSTALPDAPATGIGCSGSGWRIFDNDVVNTFGGGGIGAVYGISINSFVNSTSDAIVERNRITNTATTPASYGIVTLNVSTSLVLANRIENTKFGIVYYQPATGKFRDNVTLNVGLVSSGGIDAGGNT